MAFDWTTQSYDTTHFFSLIIVPTMLYCLFLTIFVALSDAFLLTDPTFVVPRIRHRLSRSFSNRPLLPPDGDLGPTLFAYQDDLRDPGTGASNIIPFYLHLGAGLFSPLVAVASTTSISTISSLDPRFFVAGGLCAAVSHGATTPIDVVKTRMQASPGQFRNGVREAALKILRQDGVGTLLTGLTPTVVGYGLEGAAKFGLYESLKPELARLVGLDNQAFSYLMASMIAGAVASIILCPMERARIRLVTDPTFASNFLSAVPKLFDQVGIAGLFDGFPAMLSKQVPYTAGKQVSFDVFCGMLYSALATAGFPEDSVKLEVSFGAAALASVVACLLSHPGDVILTASYRNASSQSFGDAISSIFESRGFSGFFLAGITARFLHVGVIITTQLVLYDTMKQLLGLPATGSS